MAHNKQMRYIQSYVEDVLNKNSRYKDITIGEKIPDLPVDNRQKKRHVYARGYDGNNFLILAHADPMDDVQYRKKIKSFKDLNLNPDIEENIHVLPVFFRNDKFWDDTEFFQKPYLGNRDAINYYPEDVKERFIETKKLERTSEKLFNRPAEHNLYYFNFEKEELEEIELDPNFDVIGQYYDSPNIPYNERKLKTMKLTNVKDSMENFDLTTEGDYIALPVNIDDELDNLYQGIEKAESCIQMGDYRSAESILDATKKRQEQSRFNRNMFARDYEQLYREIEQNK